MRERPDAVEADLQRFYGVDIRDRWATGPHRLTWRRMSVLLAHLPPEAATRSPADGIPRPSAVELRLLEVLSTLTGEQHPYLERLDDASQRARGAEVKNVRGSDLAERAARYARGRDNP